MKSKYKSLSEIARFDELLYRVIETLFLASNETSLTQETQDIIEKILRCRETIINEKDYHEFM